MTLSCPIFADINGYVKLYIVYTCSKHRNYRAKTSLCSVHSSN